MKKISYPKNRKQRLLTDTMTFKLLNNFDWEEVVAYYVKWGRNKTGEKFDTSSYIVRYVMELYDIKRPLPAHLKKAYFLGNWPGKNKKMKANYVENHI